MSGAKTKNTPSKWGMVIDQDLCTGCQACVAACVMENNISSIGEQDVSVGRSMQWIHTERFWNGQYPDVSTIFQPILCQQCGNAPCETTCPVYASVHSDSRTDQPADLQPLRWNPLLCQQLPLSGARFQLA